MATFNFNKNCDFQQHETHFTSKGTYILRLEGWKRTFHENENQKSSRSNYIYIRQYTLREEM